YDATPTINCFSNPSQCWTASELVVHSGYATAGSFGPATLYDWAFAVMFAGDGPTTAQLQGTVDAFPIDPDRTYDENTQMYAFGYPASGKYKGRDLVYCAGKAFYDPFNSDNTYGLTCDMTGGSSGGGWVSGFDAATGNSDADSFLSSVNSYRYSLVNAIHGPKFNAKTEATWNAAVAAADNPALRGVIAGP
ncbi:MAG TPA: hypothetical protein VFR14_14440, partial [Candidatus Limnocylindrales bacterium]|nr:hypothetical protein [Candidatus Limnocylindrales bacterium]